MEKEFDVVIAGGGIAALTAALFSARLGRTTLVLSGNVIGGHLLNIEKIEGVPGFPEGIAGYDLCPMAQEQAIAAGAEFAATEMQRLEAQDRKWSVITSDGVYVARAVILATGSTLKSLGVPGEERLRGKGVSQCASCDAPLLRGQVVAVVGGGDSAMQEALTLAEAASKVIILHRGDTLSAQASYRTRVAAHPKIEVRFNTVVQEILGEDSVSGVGARDVCGATADVEVAAVFVFIGLQPNAAFLESQLRLDSSGHITTDDRMRTELHGVFAAGSVRSGSSGQAVSCAGDGAAAAIAADRYLLDDCWPEWV